MDKVKVYYNSACPVCKAGIQDQQCRMGAQASIDIEWLDVHLNPALANDVGADLETVRERLHLRNVDGSIRVGADAFAVLFQKTEGQKWLGKLLVLPLVHQLAQITYFGFARALYLWNRARGRW